MHLQVLFDGLFTPFMVAGLTLRPADRGGAVGYLGTGCAGEAGVVQPVKTGRGTKFAACGSRHHGTLRVAQWSVKGHTERVGRPPLSSSDRTARTESRPSPAVAPQQHRGDRAIRYKQQSRTRRYA